MKKKTLISILFSLLLLSVLAGCARETDDSTTQASGETVRVGTEGTYKPFNFRDENGNLTGYDIDVLKEVDRRLEDLSFEFVAAQWDSLFLGLEAGKYDMVADELTKTPERTERYLFSENSYFSAQTYIIVREEDNTIHSMDDLEGKKVGVSVGTLYANILEDYNADNGNALNISYYEGNITSIFQDLEAGRIDVAMNDKLILEDAKKTLGLKIKTAGEPVNVSPAYFMFPKTEKGELLKNKIDRALEDMIEDGTLSRISTTWFEEDLTGQE